MVQGEADDAVIVRVERPGWVFAQHGAEDIDERLPEAGPVAARPGRLDAHRSASRTGRSVRRHAQARRPTLLDMEVIVRRQDQDHCASITYMIRHYVARRAQVTEGHPHNAESSMLLCRIIMLDGIYTCTGS